MSHPSPNFLTCPAVPELPAKAPETSSRAPVPPPKSPKPKALKPRARRRWVLWASLALIVALVAVTVPAAIAVTRAAFAARTAKAALARAKDDAANMDFTGVQNELAIARDALEAARADLRGIGFWRDLPGLGVQIRALEDASAAGAGTLAGAADVADVFQSIVDALRGGASLSSDLSTGIAPVRRFEDLSLNEKRDLVQKFAEALPKIRLARDKIDLALELWGRVPQNDLYAPIRSALQPLADALPVMKRSLDEIVPLLEIGVPLAGYPDPSRLLVLLQNSDELRPSGGFIGNVGTVTLDGGDLSELAIGDVYLVDNPVSATWKEVPPKTLADHLGVGAWFLRDANWSPDFPTSAERSLDFYKREIELATHQPLKNAPTGVLALEPSFFSALLRLSGPITVDGTTYDSANFFDQLEYQVEEGFAKQGIPVDKRKEVIGKIGTALTEKLKALPASRWPEILNAVTDALDRKQIQIYSRDPELLASLDRRGWSGRAKPTDGDFLWVADANLAALKTDGVMKKHVDYRLDARDPAHPVATVTLTYTNTNRTIDWRYTRYRSYTRVYVPEGSELISSSGAMKDDIIHTGGVKVAGPVDVFKELGKTVYGAFWSIEPGKTGTLSYTYRLPPSATASVDAGTYHLDWPKQAGADENTLTLTLLFGKNIRSATPSEDKEKWGDASYGYQTDSLEDRQFEITF